MKRMLGLIHGDEPIKGTDRSQTSIPAAGTIPAALLHMREKFADKGWIEILYPFLRRRAAEALACKPEQQSKCIAVAGDRIRTRLKLGCEAIREKSLKQSRERGCSHQLTPCRAGRFTRADASSRSSGIASRYQ